MSAIGQALTQLVLDIRFSQKAFPGAQDPTALATDLRLKKWVPLAGLLGANLNLLAALCGTDKFGMHEYTPVYEAIMSKWRKHPVRVLELGVGGYEHTLGGESLLMWSAYFLKGRIYGIDVVDKTSLSKGRVKVFQCSQIDRERLMGLCREIGPFDLVIDDGSHINSHQIESFRILWPFIKDGGIYIVEDVQTSYWARFGGGDLGSSGYQRSCMSFFKSLVDCVNQSEFLTPPSSDLELKRDIGSVSFHHNLIVLTKDARARSSNIPLDDPRVRAAMAGPLDPPP